MRAEFEVQIGIKEVVPTFDYTFSVFSLRGDWKDYVSTVKINFPFKVAKKKLRKMEEKIIGWWKTEILV